MSALRTNHSHGWGLSGYHGWGGEHLASMTDFDFSFEPKYQRLLRLVGVTQRTSGVRVSHDWLSARFGPWHVRTPVANVAGVELTGPYRAYRAIGARLSLADRGLTFGSTTEGGLCILFHRSVRGIEPAGLLRHPSLTVTVAEPLSLGQALTSPITGRGDAE